VTYYPGNKEVSGIVTIDNLTDRLRSVMTKEQRAPVTIVVVSHVCPAPETHGNRRRIAALLRWLRERGFRVVFVLQSLDVDGSEAVDALRRLVDEVVVVSPNPPRLRLSDVLRSLGRRVIRATGGSRATSVDAWCWPETPRAVAQAVRRTRAKAVISEYVLCSRCLENLPPGTLRIIDTHEVFFRNPERFQVTGLQAPLICTPADEKEALARAQVLIAIQKNDAEALRALFPEKIVITAAYGYVATGRDGRMPADGIVFYVGSPNPFNVHGLGEFLARAWPRILDARPDATLRVVGKFPLFERAGYRGVVFLGRISDAELAAEYSRATVVINPQVAGLGLKIKCVEAISAGCPVVMHRAGADGLEEGAGWAFLVVETWEEFAHDVGRLLADRAFRRRIEEGARSFAEQVLSPKAVFSELEAVLCQSNGRSTGCRG
jgi:glycosyltransferase involved in cell wall biosynthesis